jgi:hypothetical protein
MFDPTAMVLADKATRRELGSAGPRAPIRPHRPGRRPRTDAGRLLIATMLRRLAARVEPRSVRACQPAS